MDRKLRQLQRRAQQGDYHSQERLNRLIERINPSRIKAEDMRSLPTCNNCNYPMSPTDGHQYPESRDMHYVKRRTLYEPLPYLCNGICSEPHYHVSATQTLVDAIKRYR